LYIQLFDATQEYIDNSNEIGYILAIRNVVLCNDNEEAKNNVRRELTVRSTVIHWQEDTMDIKDTDGNKHTIPLGWSIDVVMVGYPDREQKTMPARELGPYMERGYIIERIAFEAEHGQ
jgi:hypothetical protein